MSPPVASAPSRTPPGCGRAMRRTCSTRSTRVVRERRFRLVVDYGYSAASFVLPLVVGPLGVEAISAHGFFAEEVGDRETLAQAIGHTKRLVTAIGADLGAVFDQSGERLYLVDEQGHEVPVDQALLLFVSCSRSAGRGQGGLPDHGHEQDRRSRRRSARDHPDAELAQRADERGGRRRRRLCGRGRRRLRLSGVPARLRRRREPREAARAPRADGRPLSELVGELPAPTLSTAGSPVPGRRRASSCACSTSGWRDATSISPTESSSGRARLVAGAARSRRAARASVCRRRHNRSREQLERELRDLLEEIMQGDSAAPRTSVEASS